MPGRVRKPHQWGFGTHLDKGLLEPGWEWFFRDLAYFLPLWERTETPVDYASGVATTFTGNAAWQFGPYGSEVTLDGAGDYITTVGYKGVAAGGTRTSTVGVTQNSDANQDVYCEYGATGAGNAWTFRNNDSTADGRIEGAIRLQVNSGLLSGRTDIRGTGPHLISAVLPEGLGASPDVNECLLYVDGIKEAATSSAAQTVSTNLDADITVGHSSVTGLADLHGEVWFYAEHSRGLTDGELAQLGRDPFGPMRMFDDLLAFVAAVAAANPKGPLGHPLHGAFGGPIG